MAEVRALKNPVLALALVLLNAACPLARTGHHGVREAWYWRSDHDLLVSVGLARLGIAALLLLGLLALLPLDSTGFVLILGLAVLHYAIRGILEIRKNADVR